MNKLKFFVLSGLLLLLGLVSFVGIASAQAVKTGDNVTVAANEKVDSMLFAAGNNIDIAGEVNGDVYCAGQTVTISGKVTGDVFCAGQTVRVSGTVDGSVRLAGQTVSIDGKVDGSATIAAQSFSLDGNAVISRDLLGGTNTATLNGMLTRDLAIGASNVQVNNQVGRNIKGSIENLNIASTAKVGGNLEYTSKNQPNISNGAQVAGKVTITAPKEEKKATFAAPVAFTFLTVLYIFVALLVVILALALLIPRFLHESATQAIKNPGKTTLVGFLAVIAVPVLIFTLFATIIGAPLGFMVLLAWILIILLSGPFTGYVLGRLLLKNSKSPLLIALVGGSLLLALYFIPFVGFVALLFVYIFGTGIVVNELIQRLPKPSQSLH